MSALGWTQASTLTDFGACTAEFLAGRLGHMPTPVYDASVSAETRSLLSVLMPLNQSGKFITIASQPACTPSDRRMGGTVPWQRAAVMGFVPTTAIDQVAAALRVVGLSVSISRPGSPSRPATMLASKNRREDVTWYGDVLSPGDIAQNYGALPGDPSVPGLQPRLVAALQACYQVCAVDQQWGRNNVLWPLLERLCRQ